MRLQTETGEYLEIAVAQSSAPRTARPLDVDPRFRDTAAESKGRGPTLFSQKEPRVKVYRGSVETLVASSQAGFLLSQGFTASPTSVAPPITFLCGVETLEGEICHKMLRTDRDRINHIRITHSDVAPWILSEEDMLKSKGKVVFNGRGAVSTNSDPRVTALEAKVDELLKLLGKSAAPEIAKEIAADLTTELDLLRAGAEEFMTEGVEEVVPIKVKHPRVAPPDDQPRHTCTSLGRFGRHVDGCPACEFRKARREALAEV